MAGTTTNKKNSTNSSKKITKKTSSAKSTSAKQKTSQQTKKQSIKKEIKVVEHHQPAESKIPKLKKIYIAIIIILSILLLISSTIEIINIITPPQNELPTEIEAPTKPEEEKIDLNLLFSEDLDLDYYRKENNNAEIVGRLEIPEVLNLLLTQTKDNDYYIEYNIKRKRSNKGTEFVDYRTKLTDKQVNVYGHNSRLYDLPFKKLENFLDKEFFNQNEYILLQHEDGRRIYQIAAVKRITTDYEHMIVTTTSKKHIAHIDKLLSNTIQKRNLKYDENTNLLILQTCTRERNVDAYYILVAFEVNES